MVLLYSIKIVDNEFCPCKYKDFLHKKEEYETHSVSSTCFVCFSIVFFFQMRVQMYNLRMTMRQEIVSIV